LRAPQSNASRQAGGPNIAPDTPGAEGADYGEVVVTQRLSDALRRKPISGEPRVKDAEKFVESNV
jgi:hypothetical protein